jgi:hypothetical protein
MAFTCCQLITSLWCETSIPCTVNLREFLFRNLDRKRNAGAPGSKSNTLHRPGLALLQGQDNILDPFFVTCVVIKRLRKYSSEFKVQSSEFISFPLLCRIPN